MRRRGVGRVYVARGLDSGFIKIGYTIDVRQRARCLASVVEPVEVIAAFVAAPWAEPRLHRRFAASLVPWRGLEWFRPDPAVLAWVDSLPSRTRCSLVARVKRRRSAYITPEQSEAARVYRETLNEFEPGNESAFDAVSNFLSAHHHLFVPGEYAVACAACHALATRLPSAPVDLLALAPDLPVCWVARSRSVAPLAGAA